MTVLDPKYRFQLGNPDEDPLSGTIPSKEDLESALGTFILSASGWRKVFATDGDEESTTEEIAPADRYLVAGIALVFANFLKDLYPGRTVCIVLGTDSRFTGPAIAEIMIRIFLSQGLKIRYTFITAAPELMAYTKIDPETKGFAYISASHNPIGHNGLKFGLAEGGVLKTRDAIKLINDFLQLFKDPAAPKRLKDLSASISPDDVMDIYDGVSRWKHAAFKVYSDFTNEVYCGGEDHSIIARLRAQAASAGIGIIAELNGSARGTSIDKVFLSELGVKVKMINDFPRQIVHRIVPEGKSLNLCREELEKAHREDPSFLLGYVSDNDGDRGNIVYLNSSTGKAHILEAQEVFALTVLGELAFLYTEGKLGEGVKAAVVVNGPTSTRIEEIAGAFAVEVHRCEVGEANVVERAGQLRQAGYIVRILGEGSNGGNITHPAAVRDPLNTIGTLLKLLLLRGGDNRQGLFETWWGKSKQSGEFPGDFSISDIIATLPQYQTTSAYEDRALMKIESPRHGLLKERYEELFARYWKQDKDTFLKDFGITGWKEMNYEGTRAKEGVGSQFRSGEERGGLKILFHDSQGRDCAYIWMRGSGTEPVFRILADVKGDYPEKEEWLLSWHRKIIEEADSSVNSYTFNGKKAARHKQDSFNYF